MEDQKELRLGWQLRAREKRARRRFSKSQTLLIIHFPCTIHNHFLRVFQSDHCRTIVTPPREGRDRDREHEYVDDDEDEQEENDDDDTKNRIFEMLARIAIRCVIGSTLFNSTLVASFEHISFLKAPPTSLLSSLYLFPLNALLTKPTHLCANYTHTHSEIASLCKQVCSRRYRPKLNKNQLGKRVSDSSNQLLRLVLFSRSF